MHFVGKNCEHVLPSWTAEYQQRQNEAQFSTVSNGLSVNYKAYLAKCCLNMVAYFVACIYMKGNEIFYVTLESNQRKIKCYNIIIELWNDNWVQANIIFEEILQNDEDLEVFSGQIFMLWNDNHCLQVWLPIINLDHTHDSTWHYILGSIIFDIKRDIATMSGAFHEVNWYFFHFFLLFVPFICFLFFIFIGYSFCVSYHGLFYFIMRNYKTYVPKHLLHKLFRIQSVIRQPLLFLFFLNVFIICF